MAIPELDFDSFPINTIINRIEQGEIKLPPFQRDFVWNQEQIIELLDSIYKDYPIGCVIVWRHNQLLPSRRNLGGFILPERPPEFPIDYILDGQQRLTTVYAVFLKDRQFDSTKGTDLNEKIFDIVFDLDDKKFIPKLDKPLEHKCINMQVLFNPPFLFEEIRNFPAEYQTKAMELQQKFSNYKIPFVITLKRQKEEVGIIFERINNTGTRLSPLDLMVAWTWNEDFHLKNQFIEILEDLDEKGFGDTQEKILLQCIGAIIDKSAKTKDILNLPADKVKANMEILQEGLKRTIDFISTEFNMKSSDFLPHSHQIVPLVYFYSKTVSPTPEQLKIIKQWFWKTSFSLRYSDSTDEKINEDIIFMDEIIAENFVNISKYSYKLGTLTTQKFSKSNSYTRAFLLLLSQKIPLNLVNSAKIDIGNALSIFNRKEYHHIFPQKHLKLKGVDINKINLLCNFTFLPSDSNKKISSKAPSDYFTNIIPQDDFDKILESNLLPLDKEIYNQNNYDDFLIKRAEEIKKFIEHLLL